MRILLTGASGLFGCNFIHRCAPEHQIVAFVRSKSINFPNVQIVKADIGAYDFLRSDIGQIDVIVHAAGLTSVDECQKNPTKAFYDNADCMSNLLEFSKNRKIKFVHLSTDHLFDGAESFYLEEHPLCPLNIYAESKMKAESFVLQNAYGPLVLRTNFYGWGHHNRSSFSDWIINSLSAGKKINLYDDIFVTPLYIKTMIETIMKLVSGKVEGVTNLVSPSRVSKYDFGMTLAEIFNFDRSLINRSQYPLGKAGIPRPKDMSLSSKKLEKILGYKLPSYIEDLKELKRDEEEGVAAAIGRMVE